jgi:hypothetical protein
MPVREKAISNLMAGLIGDQWYRHGICESMPHKDNQAVSELVEAIYVRLMDRLDWNRVILEASSRHLALEHDRHPTVNEISLFGVDGICGECVNEALLALDFGGKHIGAWKKEPESPRESEGSHPLPLGMGAQPRPSDEAKEATVALAKALGYTGKSYEDEV